MDERSKQHIRMKIYLDSRRILEKRDSWETLTRSKWRNKWWNLLKITKCLGCDEKRIIIIKKNWIEYYISCTLQSHMSVEWFVFINSLPPQGNEKFPSLKNTWDGEGSYHTENKIYTFLNIKFFFLLFFGFF